MTARRQPVVSVVIPCYNQGRYLGDAIRSVLQQTYPFIEAIVVDDGSTDNTGAVAGTFAKVGLIRQRNQGTAVARNAGLRESRGHYLIFLDADDRLLPQAVETHLEYLGAHPEWAFVTGHVRLIDEDGSPAGTPPQVHEDAPGYVALLRNNYIWTPGAVMYRRSVFDVVSPFESAARGSADFELNVRIARRFDFGCHHQVILEYRRHGASMSADVGLMLASAVSVRRSQRKYVRHDPAGESAWKSGIAIVQEDFGGRLVQQVTSDLRTRGRRARAFYGTLRLLRYYPSGLARIVNAAVRRLRSV